MIRKYDFSERMAFSRGARENFDIQTLLAMIDGCVRVEKTDTRLDKGGVDYVATLRNGAQVLIDAKARDKGCSKYWKKNGPEVALETWSVKPDSSNNFNGKTGWTLCEKKQTDLILFTFHPTDTMETFLVSYQMLRIAFRRHLKIWKSSGLLLATQRSDTWFSECLFVPWNRWDGIPGVEDALIAAQRGELVMP